MLTSAINNVKLPTQRTFNLRALIIRIPWSKGRLLLKACSKTQAWLRRIVWVATLIHNSRKSCLLTRILRQWVSVQCHPLKTLIPKLSLKWMKLFNHTRNKPSSLKSNKTKQDIIDNRGEGCRRRSTNWEWNSWQRKRSWMMRQLNNVSLRRLWWLNNRHQHLSIPRTNSLLRLLKRVRKKRVWITFRRFKLVFKNNKFHLKLAWKISLRNKSCINSQVRKLEMIQSIRKTSIDCLETLHRKPRVSSNVTTVKSNPNLPMTSSTMLMPQIELDGWYHLIRNYCWSCF